MSIGHFRIPGEVTRREYAVYIAVAHNRVTGNTRLYVGKTGDNREGCNPIVSRVGNHFSFNKMHSQLRNHLSPPLDDYDYDVFYTTFGGYGGPEESRHLIDLTNEMERQTNKVAQETFGKDLLVNPHQGIGHVPRAERERRSALVTAERKQHIDALVARVKEFVDKM